jgi:putative FmdB family regulatory protein
MPIYEFYCPDCHTIYSFFSARVAADAKPACPRCGRAELSRRPSRFATLSKSRAGGEGAEDGEPDPDDPFAGVDEARLERAFGELASEFDGLDDGAEPDPRQLGRVMRRFTDLTGLEAGPKLQEMLARLERGEDPDAIESEMGGGGDDADEDLSEYFNLKTRLLARRTARPRVDETLYFL